MLRREPVSATHTNEVYRKSMGKLRILLADHHQMVCRGLATLINARPDCEVVGESFDSDSVAELIGRMQPDVAVIETGLLLKHGIDQIDRLKGINAVTKLVALASDEDRESMRRLLKRGAMGFLLKRSSPDELIRAIRTVASGGRYLDPSVIDQLVDDSPADRSAVDETAATLLSEREEEVLRMIAQGFANKEIATKLGVSMKTIETYKSRSMHKLGLASRADIVRYAIGRDWLRASSP